MSLNMSTTHPEALALREPGNDCRHNGRILVQDNFDDS